MPVLTPDHLPDRERLVDLVGGPTGGFMRPRWLGYFTRQQFKVDHAPQTQPPAFERSGLAASVAFTAIPIAPLKAGFYRINALVTVTTVAGVSSLGTLRFRYPYSGGVPSLFGPEEGNNTLSATDSRVFFIRVDDQAVVEYSFTYLSNPVGVARFAIAVLLEHFPA